ncbi:PAS domain S-box protein [Desulfobulbus alkaliphilus]|uniref:PAS domain S-box protein n=1 Tax=Desulfobulbus alkaliphilus TaxID=869814 RepID=UPI001964D3D0|nr:PAS domain S-box protein [Desulfobulbus alkaliphilus]MBM9536276.1 PAS domain S-box protein [Desulfobulbus alkaliphilus]
MTEERGNTATVIAALQKKLAALETDNSRLVQENSHFRRLYEQVPLAYQSLDENGNFLSVNQAWMDALGYRADEVVGKNFGEFLHPDWRDHFKENFPRFKAMGEILGVEFEIRKKDGTYVYVSFNGRIGKDSEGNFQQTYCIFQDITRQKQMEQTLIRSETKWRNVLINTPQVAISLDPEARIVFANTHFLQLVGYRRDEVLGGDWFDLFIPDHCREQVRMVFHTTMQRKDTAEFSTYENEIVTRNGELRNVAWSNVLSKDTDGNVIDVTSLGIDLTERQKAMEALRESETRHRTILLTTMDGFWMVDTSGRLLEVNRTYCGMSGYSEEELLTMTIADLEASESPEAVARHMQKVIATGGDRFESRHRRKDGSLFDVEVSVQYSALEQRFCFVFIRDISAHKQAEQALRESETRFRTSFYTSPDAVSINRFEDGVFIDVNEGFVRLTGYTRDDVLGKSSQQINLWCNPEDRKILVKELRDKGYCENLEAEFRRKNGLIGIGLMSARMLEWQGENHILSVTRDVTSNKQLEHQLIQAQKMESIGRLAGGVAHDFNNMLGVILGYSEMAIEQVPQDHSLQTALQGIRQAAQRSADLTRQLLSFARKQTVAPKVLDLNQTLEGMLNMLRRLIGEHIDLAWLPGEDVAPVKIDPSQVDQILANLSVNARDAIGETGRITIETGNVLFDENYLADHAEVVSGEYVLLAVSDDGCGMDKETMRHVFEPFFTSRQAGEGTGLGLATVYGIVKQNNGFINVYSEPGRGTTFKIYLPRYGSKADSPVDAGEIEPSSGSETILLVEDEPMILEMVTLMLQRQGYQVLAAATPGEALRLSEEYAGTIRLLMTDVIMPEMNGRDLADALHRLFPNLKCLFMSVYTANVIAHHGVLDEGVQFIQKPFTMKDLGGKVRDALDRKPS